MAILESVPGTWGVGSFKLPDLGITEMLRMWAGKTPSGEVTTTFNNPAVIQATMGSTAPYTSSVLGATTQQRLPTKSYTTTTSGGGSGGGGGGKYTPSDALRLGLDINELRRRGLLIEEQPNIDEEVNRIRSTIESGYNEFIKKLDELAGFYPQWEQEDITRLQTSRQTGLQGLETAKQSGLEKLGLAREQALQQEQQAKGDIMSQLRQLLKASQMKAGLMGAGWSSATQQVLPAILGKQAAQAGAQVARGTISNLNQIAQKEVDVRNIFELAKNELDQDFNTKMDEIAQRYRQLKSWIETEKANASLKKAQALATLDENLTNNLINEANWYKQTYLQQQQALQQWALNRIAQLQDYKIQLGQLSNFSPEQLTYQALQGLGGLTGRESGGWGEDIFGSLVDTAKRKRELLGL